MSFLIFRGSGVRFAIPSMPCGLNLRGKNKTKNPLWGMGGNTEKSTFLRRVNIFYFSLFLDNSKLYFCAHKSRFAHIVGYRFDISF